MKPSAASAYSTASSRASPFAPLDVLPSTPSGIGACSIHVILDRRGEFVVPWHGLGLVNGALLAWEISFMLHDGPLDRFPTRYRWWLFLLGVALAGAGFGLAWYQNLPSRLPERVRLPGSV